MSAERFHIHIADEVLDDLKRRPLAGSIGKLSLE